MYRFYYSFQDEIYGVLEHYTEKSILEVELLRTQEREQIESDWLLEQIKDGKVDISKDKDLLEMYERNQFISDLV